MHLRFEPAFLETELTQLAVVWELVCVCDYDETGRANGDYLNVWLTLLLLWLLLYYYYYSTGRANEDAPSQLLAHDARHYQLDGCTHLGGRCVIAELVL